MHLQFEVWDHNNMELYSMVTQSKSLGFGLLSLPLLLTALSSSTSSSELELPELVDGGITLSRALERGLWVKGSGKWKYTSAWVGPPLVGLLVNSGFLARLHLRHLDHQHGPCTTLGWQSSNMWIYLCYTCTLSNCVNPKQWHPLWDAVGVNWNTPVSPPWWEVIICAGFSAQQENQMSTSYTHFTHDP